MRFAVGKKRLTGDRPCVSPTDNLEPTRTDSLVFIRHNPDADTHRIRVDSGYLDRRPRRADLLRLSPLCRPARLPESCRTTTKGSD